jgi:hypothetical protein
MQAVNPKTGEVLELRGGRWVPVDKAPADPEATPAKRDKFAEDFRVSTGLVDAALASAGDQLTTMGRNVRDLWAGVRGDSEAQKDIAVERVNADAIRSQLHNEAPIAAGIGAALPSLATLPLGAGIGGVGMLAGAGGRLATNIATSAALGGLSSDTGDIAGGALEGGALAGATSMAGNMVARVRAGRQAAAATRAQQAAGAAVGELDDAQRSIIEGARRAGMHVTPGQALGDATMRKLEASATSNPVLSPYWDRLKAENARQINTLAARAMGENADNVGAGVLARAEHRIGQEFENIGQQIGTVDTKPLQKKLGELASEESTALLPRAELEGLLNRFERGYTARSVATGGEGANLVTGEALMRERSRISKQMRDAYTRGDSTLGELYGNVVEAMDDAVKASAAKNLGSRAAGLDVAAAYDTARDQWTVLRAMHRGAATVDGQVLPGQAARIIGQSDKTRFAGRAGDSGQTLQRGGTGRLGEDPTGDLYDALRFASSQLGKDIVGDSGTATRLATSGWFEGGLGPTVARAAGYAARRAGAGPLATRYMAMSPEAAQAWNAALQQSSLAGWSAGLGAGGAAARAGQAGATGIMGGPE